MPQKHPAYTREFGLIILDMAANELAIRKLLYDAGIADEKSFGEAYLWASEQLSVARQAIEKHDASQLLEFFEGQLRSSRRVQ